MIEGGEDPRFLARRMVILASEDIGLADPKALLIAEAAARAVEYVGLPEAALNLAEAVDLPGPGPQVERGHRRPGPGPGRRALRGCPRRCRPTCATPTTSRPGPSATARATSTPMTTPGTVRQQYRPDALEGHVTTSRPRTAQKIRADQTGSPSPT